MLLSGACIGAGIGVLQSCGLTIAVQASPEEHVGLANSTYYIFMDIAVGFGPTVLGLLQPFTGYRGMYVAWRCSASAACRCMRASDRAPGAESRSGGRRLDFA